MVQKSQHRTGGYLTLQQNDIAARLLLLDACQDTIQVMHTWRIIGARHNQDPVLTASRFFNNHIRGARTYAIDPLNMLGTDTRRRERRLNNRREVFIVPTNGANHGHQRVWLMMTCRTRRDRRPTARHGLVGAFTAHADLRGAGGKCLAGSRTSWRADGVVDVEGADDADVRLGGWRQRSHACTRQGRRTLGSVLEMDLILKHQPRRTCSKRIVGARESELKRYMVSG